MRTTYLIDKERLKLLEILQRKKIRNPFTYKPNYAECSFLDPEVTHFELVKNEEIKNKFVGIVHDDYLVFKCHSGRTSAIECSNIISHISVHHIFFVKVTDDYSIYLLIRIKGV